MSGMIYFAEKILKKKRHPKKGTLYYVKWEGYPNSANTWEPASNFTREFIEKFESSCMKKKRKLTHPVGSETPTADKSQEPSDRIIPSCSSPAASCSSSSTICDPTLQETNEEEIYSEQSSSIAAGSNLRDPVEEEDRNSGSQSMRDKAPTKSNGRSRPRKDPMKMRQEQIEIQRTIEQKQQIQSPAHADKKFSVFNPVGSQVELPIVREVVYEAALTKEPIVVTDVTTNESTITISECKTSEGFFSR